ncbi:MAG: bifunctional hydroxymethylpyrimidine kinase/phosphomethylpyrimidine kinase [Magnetovibrio sp.]|nr:bifunctional hydroxymethylpyrimidine kinase/phosphomethylpyrimidine kinase [Magnetovibrio sp.]
MKGRVLIIAGSDSGGGAGIQADIKTVTALGGYAMTSITAVTAQNTLGVNGIHEIPVDFIDDQIRVVLGDLGADSIKVGMLHSSEVIETVANVLSDIGQDIPVVLDPVMVAKGGAALLMDEAIISLKNILLDRAALLTPNIPEAEVLTGIKITSNDDLCAAGEALLELGVSAVLMKGGHLKSDIITDIFMDKFGKQVFSSPRQETVHTHGTGCTLSSACAAGLAHGLMMVDAVSQARSYVQEAIRTAPGYGAGHGPLNHGFPFHKPELLLKN